MGGTQTGCLTSDSLGEGRRLLPFCWGGFHECFWTYLACKIRKTISSGFFGKVRSMHFVRPLDLPKRARCSTPALCHYLQDGTTFSLGKAERFREQIYVQPWNSTGGGKGSTERFGKAWQTQCGDGFNDPCLPPPPSLALARRSVRIPGRGQRAAPAAKGDVRPHQVAAEQIAGKRSSIAWTLALNIYVFSYCPVTARVLLFGERKGCWPPVTALI